LISNSVVGGTGVRLPRRGESEYALLSGDRWPAPCSRRSDVPHEPERLDAM